ncbi:14294_t:CDS:2, partial [Racocetra fulgida]
QNHEGGFQACPEYNTNFPNECSSIPTKIKEIITSDIYAKLLVIYKKLKSSEFEDFDYGLIDHTKDIVNFCAKEFDEPIYYLAFFLNSKFQKIAISKKLTFDDIVVYALTFAQITSTLKMISQIKLVLSAKVFKKCLDKKLLTRNEQDNNYLDDYNTLFSLDLIDLINDEDNELEFNNIQEIYLESVQNNSELFIEKFINFNIIDELVLTSDNIKENLEFVLQMRITGIPPQKGLHLFDIELTKIVRIY